MYREEVDMKAVYPVIFTETDDGVLVEVPDLEIQRSRGSTHQCVKSSPGGIDDEIRSE